jgi:hypothetical protein
MGAFSVDVKAFCEKAKKNPETVMRSVSLKLFSAIILGSPVDTGRFRMNWQAAGAVPATGEVPGEDKTGSNSINAASEFIKATNYWEDVTLTNNLPYAEVIEYGGYATGFHGAPKPMKETGSKFVGPLRPKAAPKTNTSGFSLQAPQGVVRVNVLRFQQLLDEEAAKVK